MSDRDERIENYYHQSAWDLAEWLVDAEDAIARLEDDSKWLAALEAAGVDNWQGYDVACQIYQGEIDEDDI